FRRTGGVRSRQQPKGGGARGRGAGARHAGPVSARWPGIGIAPRPLYFSVKSLYVPAMKKQAVTESAAPARKVFVKTYGCQMNVYDSQRMTDALGPEGYSVTDSIEDADLVLLNTCHIREKAAEKVYSELGRIRQVKAARSEGGQETIIAVAGCVAQAEGEEIIRRAPLVDLVIGPQTYHRLPEALLR